MGKLSQWWKQFKEKEATQKVIAFFKKVGFVLKLTFRWCYKLRSLVMSIPVFVCAGALAIRNARLLPDMVGVNILANGEYQWFISRGAAVLIPFAVTTVCLLLMLISKKTLYPWLISLFSLVIPALLWFTSILAG